MQFAICFYYFYRSVPLIEIEKRWPHLIELVFCALTSIRPLLLGFFSYLNIQKNSSLNISLYTKSYSLKKYLNTIMKYSQSSPYLHFGFWDLVIFFPFLQRNNTYYHIFCKLFAYVLGETN